VSRRGGHNCLQTPSAPLTRRARVLRGVAGTSRLPACPPAHHANARDGGSDEDQRRGDRDLIDAFDGERPNVVVRPFRGTQIGIGPLAKGLKYDCSGSRRVARKRSIRRSELTRLRWADVDMRGRTIRFFFTKNGHARSVPMTDTLFQAFSALPRPLSPEAPVLPVRDGKVVSRSFARLVKDLEIPNLHFHDVRHDVASTLTMNGVSQRGVMEILGHRDPRMTMKYHHLTPGHLRDAMTALDTTEPRRPAREKEA